MHSPVKRLATLSLAAAAWSSMALMTGCDTSGSSDSRVHDAMAQSRAAVRQGGEDAAERARAAIEEVQDATADASAATRALARSALGQLQLDAAHALHSDAQRLELAAARVAMDVALMAGQVGAAATVIEAYRQYDPEPVSAQLQALGTEIKGGADRNAWSLKFENFQSQLPTLSELKNRISALDGQITQRNEQIEQLRQQRGQLINQSEELARASEAAEGEQSVQLFKQASELRKQASDIAVQIQSIEASIQPLQGDMELAQAQAQVLERAVQQLETQAAEVKKAWSAIRERVSAHQGTAQQIVGEAEGADSPGELYANLSQAANALNRLVQQAEQLREDALQNTRDAAKHFGDAQSAADDLRRQIGEKMAAGFQTRPEAEAWKRARETVNPAFYQLQQGNALRLEGDALASKAASIRVRLDLQEFAQDALQRVNIETPSALQDPNLPRVHEETVAQADEAYAQAEEKYQNVLNASAEDSTGRSATVQRVFGFYGRAHLAATSAQPEDAQKYMTEAADALKLAVERRAALPTLPGPLQALVPPPAPPQPPEMVDDVMAAPDATAPGAAAPGTAAPEGQVPPAEEPAP